MSEYYNAEEFALYLVRMAEEADQKPEMVLKTMVVLEKDRRRRHEARSASPDDRSAIADCIKKMVANGGIREDVSPKELLRANGLKQNAGTINFAWRQLKLALTDQSAKK
jgi:hypothetical protein